MQRLSCSKVSTLLHNIAPDYSRAMLFYAGITKDWVCTRAKRVNYPNKPYSFEVIKIELLDFPSNNSILDMRVADYNKSSQVALAKILQNVEKSYDKGKFLLEESKKSDAWDAIFRRY